ncbi:MAG: carboxymethylenebutenolidase [Propionibacteriaceae bacterium]|jgi:carboxymethylenebutenolidase|nr:dienelactone hydrolase [Propionibacteriaceae bacterium]MDX6320218.1 carboxymethylenebutenolidase [Propionibacteriaceae bacterium]
MSQFDQYLTEEVVEDYSDGIITRREALRRLALLGVAAAVAVPLLAACDAAGQGPAGPTTAGPADPSSASATPAGPSPLPAAAITFKGPDNRELQGAWAAADQPRGAVLVVHENRGLTDHIRSVAGRLAASGFSALAIDLLSEEGGTASFNDEGEVTAALNNAPDSRFVADMKAAVGELQRRTPEAKIGAVGFCFGGGMVWTLLASGEPRLAAASPFYGPLPDGADFAGSPNAAVLGVYGEQDERVNATRDAAKQALEKAGLTHEIVTYPNAGHAFFNDTGQRYNATAAAAAYEKLTGWFNTHLG